MTRHVSEEREKLAAKLRVTTEQMAHRCSVDQVLWNMHSNACLEAADLLLSTSSAERGRREAAVALSKEVDRMWNDPHRFNPPAWESHAKAICSAQQDLSAAIETATIAGDAS